MPSFLRLSILVWVWWKAAAQSFQRSWKVKSQTLPPINNLYGSGFWEKGWGIHTTRKRSKSSQQRHKLHCATKNCQLCFYAPALPLALAYWIPIRTGVASEQKEDREVATKVAMPGPRRLKVVRARNLEANKGDALLQVLSQSTTLEELSFYDCSQIPAAAWQRLHGADWRNLKIARFDRQLGRGRGDVSWNWYLLFPLALVGDVNKCFGWMLRSHLDWLGMLFSWLEFWWIYIGVSCHSVTLNWYLCCSILPVSPCTRCFGDDSKGVDGAADLLQVLGKATALEELSFYDCSQIPAAAWQRLHGADWRNLKIASFKS